MSRLYDLGPFRLDAELGALTRAGVPQVLGVRAVAVLALLVECAPDFVSKRQLMDTAWRGLVVEESNLAVQIHAIRRVLAQQPGGDDWVQTLIGRGYRFAGPVVASATEASHRSDGASKSNLPEPLTSFVGRERDLVAIKRLLAMRRLITIVGMGGIGKTRLAQQVAAEVIGAYRDGVWFVDLASARDLSRVPSMIAQTLNVKERDNESLIDALCRHLRPLQILLIIDNCEHLLGGCARTIESVLKSTSQTTIVATSREPLRATGEQVYSLPPLSLPELDADVDTLHRSEAVQLLVERLREQLPDFALTTERAATIAQLCIHLDGIPLALELAAARARSLSIIEINIRLGQRFRLLTAGPRPALPRQQTLRATVDWSYDLLSEEERVVLRRLAIFPASFTLEAACAVVSDASIDEFAIVDVLSQLVARSLLIADTTAGVARYRLLETMRAYAQEKMLEAAEENVLAQRHAEYFDRMFERAPDDFLRLTDARLRELYVPELEHVRAALDWSFTLDERAALGIRLAGSAGPLWGMLGLFSEGAQRVELALTRLRPGIPERDEALLWRQLGRLVDETPVRALPAFERAAKLYRRIQDPAGLAHTLIQFSRALARVGRFDAAEDALLEAHSLLAHVDLPWLHGLYYFHLATLKSLQNDFATARTANEHAHVLFMQAGDEFTAAAAQGNLANVAWALGDLAAAGAAFGRVIALLRASPVRTKRMLGWSLASLAGVMTESGALDEALAAGQEALPLLLEDGTAWQFIGHFALRAALADRLSDAARLSGYWDGACRRQQAQRHPIDERTRERLMAVLKRQLPDSELGRLRAEGEELSEAQACRLAVAD